MKLRFLVLLSCLCAPFAAAQQPPVAVRDEFFWLGQMNKATAVINTDEGLLDGAMAPRIAAGIAKVLSDAAAPGARRPSSVITFEPLLIQAAGPDVTLLHAGRSSQDMHATYRAAILRDDLLNLADQLNKTSAALVGVAQKHVDTIVPNYTVEGGPAEAGAAGRMDQGEARADRVVARAARRRFR